MKNGDISKIRSQFRKKIFEIVVLEYQPMFFTDSVKETTRTSESHVGLIFVNPVPLCDLSIQPHFFASIALRPLFARTPKPSGGAACGSKTPPLSDTKRNAKRHGVVGIWQIIKHFENSTQHVWTASRFLRGKQTTQKIANIL